MITKYNADHIKIQENYKWPLTPYHHTLRKRAAVLCVPVLPSVRLLTLSVRVTFPHGYNCHVRSPSRSRTQKGCRLSLREPCSYNCCYWWCWSTAYENFLHLSVHAHTRTHARTHTWTDIFTAARRTTFIAHRQISSECNPKDAMENMNWVEKKEHKKSPVSFPVTSSFRKASPIPQSNRTNQLA